jgi:hypothetical protein
MSGPINCESHKSLADKFTLVVNLRTAKVLGVTVPDKIFTIADELIE